jgi:hypothetical protein
MELCHATHSDTNPFVEIEPNVRALKEGHETEDGDIIPAPAGRCPAGEQRTRTSECPPASPNANALVHAAVQAQDALARAFGRHVANRAAGGPPCESAPAQQQAQAPPPAGAVQGQAVSADQLVLEDELVGGVLGATAEAPATTPAVAGRSDVLGATEQAAERKELPFTGLQLLGLVLLAAASLIAGVALYRVSTRDMR